MEEEEVTGQAGGIHQVVDEVNFTPSTLGELGRC